MKMYNTNGVKRASGN